MAERDHSLARPDIEVVGCSKQFGGPLVLREISFEVRAGEFVAVLGPSGCGKTTMLRIVGGFLAPDAGEIFIRGRQVTALPPHRRNIGVVFQSYALWPHMTVFENVAFGLRIRGLPKVEMGERVRRALAVVRLEGMDDRFPGQLSGGQQQRVALARALAIQPDVIILDEPLSNLDRQLREEMRIELKTLQQSLGVTALYVTHDQDEALSMADRIIVMNEGRIQQVASPQEAYERPTNRFVAGFLGHANFITGRVTAREGESVSVHLDAGAEVDVQCPFSVAVGQAVSLVVRPERVEVTNGSVAAGRNLLPARVRQVVYEGAAIRYGLEVAGRTDLFFTHELPGAALRQPGERVVARIQAAMVIRP